MRNACERSPLFRLRAPHAFRHVTGERQAGEPICEEAGVPAISFTHHSTPAAGAAVGREIRPRGPCRKEYLQERLETFDRSWAWCYRALWQKRGV